MSRVQPFMWLLETSVEFNRYVIDHLKRTHGTVPGHARGKPDHRRHWAGGRSDLQSLQSGFYPKAGPLLNISQEEIGELAGLSRSTTNMAITKLKKLKLVNTDGGLLILDLDRLRAFVHSMNGSEVDAVTTA